MKKGHADASENSNAANLLLYCYHSACNGLGRKNLVNDLGPLRTANPTGVPFTKSSSGLVP